eukprot:4112272-Amphidinium_carterae.3
MGAIPTEVTPINKRVSADERTALLKIVLAGGACNTRGWSYRVEQIVVLALLCFRLSFEICDS